jgi:hypothetical protein
MIGDLRYSVEYLDYAQGVALMKAAGADPEKDGMWDCCDQDEITVCKRFPSKWRAVAWAKKNKKLDVFNMPRIVEETYCYMAGDDIHNPSKPRWTQTGYWEADGRTEIDPTEYPRDQ